MQCLFKQISKNFVEFSGKKIWKCGGKTVCVCMRALCVSVCVGVMLGRNVWEKIHRKKYLV
jgi:hypothetical protein